MAISSFQAIDTPSSVLWLDAAKKECSLLRLPTNTRYRNSINCVAGDFIQKHVAATDYILHSYTGHHSTHNTAPTTTVGYDF